MDSIRELINKLLELIEKLKGRRCFTEEEIKEVEEKLRLAVDELSKIVG